MNIKYVLQKQIYAFIIEGQQMRKATFKIENEIGYVEEKLKFLSKR